MKNIGKLSAIAFTLLSCPALAATLGTADVNFSATSYLLYEGQGAGFFGSLGYTPSPAYQDSDWSDNYISGRTASALTSINWTLTDLTQNRTLGSGSSTYINGLSDSFADDGSYVIRLSESISDAANGWSQSRYWASSGEYQPYQTWINSGYWESYSCGWFSTCSRWVDTSHYETAYRWVDTSHYVYGSVLYWGDYGSGTYNRDINVTVMNLAPVIQQVSAPTVVNVGEEFTFFASAWDPGVRDLLTYSWDLNEDGIFGDYFGAGGRTSFGHASPHSIGVQVSDGDGGVATARYVVEVNGPANNVPEPATLALAGVALAGLGLRRRKAGTDA